MRCPKRKFLYVHSGGVTPILNKGLCDILHAAERYGYQGLLSPLGVLGALEHEFLELDTLPSQELAHTPGSHLSTARIRPDDDALERLLRRLQEASIDTLFIQGGDDSQDTLHRLQLMATHSKRPIQCIGIPKTIDNDLSGTHVSPGYPSAAKYLAVSFMEAAWDMMAMHHTSTKVFVFETMGRDAGWLAAATTLVSHRYELPHLLCVPERSTTRDALMQKMDAQLSHFGYCLISLAESYPFAEVPSTYHDAFGHRQLGYQGPLLSEWIEQELRVKVRYGRPDCLQRSAGHLLARFDWAASEHLAKHAIQAMHQGDTGIMLTLQSEDPSQVSSLALADVIHRNRSLPADYLNHDGQSSQAFVKYLEPLISGEVYPSYDRGLPRYTLPKNPTHTRRSCT